VVSKLSSFWRRNVCAIPLAETKTKRNHEEINHENAYLIFFPCAVTMKQLWGRMGPWGSPKPQTSSSASHHAFGASMAGHQVTLTVGSAPAKVFLLILFNFIY
jgi:hypothetical protein